METALTTFTKKGKQNKSGKKEKSEKPTNNSVEECDNCGRPGHGVPNCYSKGGGKEDEAPWKTKGKKLETASATVAVANDEENELFAFTCTSDFTDVAASSNLPKSKLGMCLDSGVSTDYSPDWTKFSNYQVIKQ